MTYERFKDLWTTLVTNRAQKEAVVQPEIPLTNGVSAHTVDALIALADGDDSAFKKAREIRNRARA